MIRLLFLMALLGPSSWAAMGASAPELLPRFESEMNSQMSADFNSEMFAIFERSLTQKGYRFTERQLLIDQGEYFSCEQQPDNDHCELAYNYQYVKQFEGPQGRRFLVQEGVLTLDPSTRALLRVEIKYQGLTREPKKLGIESEEE